MANQADQYGLDPYQAEEDEIALLQRLALEKLLRKPPQGQMGTGGILIGGPNFASAMRDTMDRSEGERDLKGLEGRRRELAAKSQADLLAAAGGTPEQMMAHPAMRQTGAALIKRRKDMELDQQEMAGMFGGGQGGALPGSIAEIRQKALMMAMSSNPTIAARGKELLKQLEGRNPRDSYTVNPLTGQGEQDPAALRAYAGNQQVDQEANAALEMVEVPIGGGRKQMMTKLEAAKRFGYSPQSPQSAQAGGPIPAPTLPPGTGVGAAPQGATGMGGPTPTLAAPPNASPEHYLKLFYDAVKSGNMTAASMYGSRLAEMGVKVDISMAMSEPQRQNMVATSDPSQMPHRPPQAPPGTQPQMATTQVPPAVGAQFGLSDPEGAEFRREAATSGRKQLEKFQEKKIPNEQVLSTLDRLSELNLSDKVIGGPFANAKLVAMRAMGQQFGTDMTGVAETEEYLKETLSLLKDQLKEFGSGTGISNLDLLTAEKMLAQTLNTKEGRQRIITFMKALSQTTKTNVQGMEQYFMQNRTLDGWRARRYGPDGKEVPAGQSQMGEAFPATPPNNMNDPHVRESAQANTLPNAMKARYKSSMTDLPSTWKGMLTPMGEAENDAEEVGQTFTQSVAVLLPLALSAGIPINIAKRMLSTAAGRESIIKYLGLGIGGGAAIAGIDAMRGGR